MERQLYVPIETAECFMRRIDELEARIAYLENELANAEQELVDLDDGADYREPTDDPQNHEEPEGLTQRDECYFRPCIYGGFECNDNTCDCLGTGEIYTNVYDD